MNDLNKNTLMGAYVADAAALGLHWIYDTDRIAALAADGRPLEFREPDPKAYEGIKSYFAHANRKAGDLSHYGESAWVMAKSLKTNAGVYDRAGYIAEFQRFFGQGYDGYLDHATRETLANLDAKKKLTGADDDQMSALGKLPPLIVAHVEDARLIDLAKDAASVTNENAIAREGARITAATLRSLLRGSTLTDALHSGLKEAMGPMRTKLDEALRWPSILPAKAAQHFGSACGIPQALPLSFALLHTAKNYEEAVRANILAGGDSCGRAMFLGAVAGAIWGVPDEWVAKLRQRELMKM
jgi:ADP-ribosylglycohydrolase